MVVSSQVHRDLLALWVDTPEAKPPRRDIRPWVRTVLEQLAALEEIVRGERQRYDRLIADLQVLQELNARREREFAEQAASKARVVNTLKGVERRNQELARENRQLRAQLARRPEVEATARELLEALRRPVLRLDELLDIADRERAGHDA